MNERAAVGGGFRTALSEVQPISDSQRALQLWVLWVQFGKFLIPLFKPHKFKHINHYSQSK